MARKRIVISSAGGIAAGTPFSATPGDYLFVQQAAPPVAAGGRLKQVQDATMSVLAPGISAALRTFMLGNLVGEGPGNLRSLFVGDTISGPSVGTAGAHSDQILVGFDITQLPAYVTVDRTILIGNTPNFVFPTGAFGNSVYIGHTLTLNPILGSVDTVGSIAIGNGITINGGTAIGIGSNVVVAAESVNIGTSANGTGFQSVGIGKAAHLGGDNCVAIGRRARGGTDSIAIGFFSDTLTATSSIAIGRDADAGAFASVIVLGRSSGAAQNNEFCAGGAVAYPITQARFGPLFDSTYAGLGFQMTHSDFAGNNVVAPNFTMKAGTNTGNAAGGELRFQTATIVGAGGARQVLAERFALIPSTGAAGAAIMRFSNYTSGAAAAVGTLNNAPVAGDPATWIPIIDALGAVRYIPAW